MTRLPPHRLLITFGDCDPAGIVFYPNIFRWMDAAFHHVLHRLGGHAGVCGRLGAIGLGLMDATATFRAPMRDGDEVEIRPALARWGRRSLTVDYAGVAGGRAAFTGREVRGVFIETDGAVRAGDTAPLRAIFEAAGIHATGGA